MKSYITKPKSIKIRTNYSLSARDYRVLSSKNKNVKILKDIIISEFQWKEIWSDGYLGQSKYRFLKTGNIWKSSFLLDTGNIEYCFPVNQKHPKDGDILIAKDGGWDGLWDVILYKKSLEYIDTISAGIHCITPEHKNRYYIFWLLKTQFFKNFVDLNTAWWSIIRHAKKIALDFPLPFPTIKNHPHPEQVEEYISLLAQNMIDKEEQIKIRNNQIDGLIGKELQENQKQNIFTYTIPKISELKMEGRLDAWYYGEKYKKEDSYFKYYTWWYHDMFSLGYEISRWQNLQVSNIGESWYFDEYKKWSYRLLLSKYFGNRIIERFSYIWNKCELKTIKKWDIIFSCRWEMWRAYYFPEEIENTITNIDNVHIIATSRSIEEKTYLFCILWFLKKKWILDSIACTGSGAPSFTKYQFEKLKIPNFPDSKQQELAKLYYHTISNNTDLTLETYLERERIRNSEVGIFQLNMEIFALREKLEETIDRIVMESIVEIVF